MMETIEKFKKSEIELFTFMIEEKIVKIPSKIPMQMTKAIGKKK